MNESPLRLAVFDVDGTLVDSQHNIVAAMTSAFESCAVSPPPPARVRRIIGLSLTEAVAALAPDPALVPQLAARYSEAFVTLRNAPDFHEPLFPGMADLLDTLEAAGWVLGVATGKSRRGVDRFLDHHGLTGRFLTVQTADQGPGKPDPAMLHRALRDTGAEAPAAVMVGDTVYDMEMAARAGMPGVGVAWGYHPAADLAAAGARYVAADSAALRTWLEAAKAHEAIL